MPLIQILERIQETGLSRTISESTWGYPIVGALHVLAMALFAGWLLLDVSGNNTRAEIGSPMSRQISRWKTAGFVLVTLTGILLFISLPVHYYASTAFRIKLVLIVLALLSGMARRWAAPFAWIALGLWAAVILSSRGIAFY